MNNSINPLESPYFYYDRCYDNVWGARKDGLIARMLTAVFQSLSCLPTYTEEEEKRAPSEAKDVYKRMLAHGTSPFLAGAIYKVCSALPYLNQKYVMVVSDGLKAGICWEECNKAYHEGRLAASHVVKTATAVGICFISVKAPHLSHTITTIQDILGEAARFKEHVTQKRYEEAGESLLKLTKQVIYLMGLVTRWNVEIAAVSVLLDCLSQVIEVSKKETIWEVFTHTCLLAFLILFRVCPILNSVYFKWLRKDEREVWKETLSSYEMQVRRIFGDKELYFKKDGPSDKCLIITTTEDYNGAFSPFYLNNNDRVDLGDIFDVKRVMASDVKQVSQAIASSTLFGKVKAIIFQAHGTPLSLQFGTAVPNGFLTKQTLPLSGLSQLDTGCKIILSSCSTAKVPYQSIAYDIARYAKRVVFAPAFDSFGYAIQSINPFKVAFLGKNSEPNFANSIEIIP